MQQLADLTALNMPNDYEIAGCTASIINNDSKDKDKNEKIIINAIEKNNDESETKPGESPFIKRPDINPGKKALSVGALRLQTQQDAITLDGQVRAMVQRFAPDHETVYIDLAEAFVVARRLKLITEDEIQHAFGTARERRNAGQLDYTWRYMWGVLKNILIRSGEYSFPKIQTNKNRRKTLMLRYAQIQELRKAQELNTMETARQTRELIAKSKKPWE